MQIRENEMPIDILT